eukprot:TRINITY_DN2801_c0_g1_i1.p1 TRINITY_DN2801_c0_g1~~TRINITY_DN2801_c0_g1_i1.p1  ORF type:complete len:257 (+),score=98.68 TRINITY_DN2801_c0_g1_i1:88-858(+)
MRAAVRAAAVRRGPARPGAPAPAAKLSQRRDLTTVILGPPAGGKGTTCLKLIGDFRYHHLSTGNILRAHVRDGTELGAEAQKHMNAGDLVPDEHILKMIEYELHSMKPDSRVLLDGFPRNDKQARELEKLRKVDIVINIAVPNEEIVTRMANRWTHLGSGRVYSTDFNPPKVAGKDDVTGEPLVQREDDKPETMRRRLAQYNELTAPLIAHYKELGVLKEFTGDDHPDLVKANRRSDAIYKSLSPWLEERHAKLEG